MRIKRWIGILLCLCLGLSAVGCGGKEETGQYTLTYTVGETVYELNVEYGKTYRIETVPTRTGYVFAGLFDAQEGGTMYIDETGLSVEAWKEKADKRLYVRWTPRTYTLRLDYAGGVESERTRTVTYGEPLEDLPVSYKEHYEFQGWYTLPDCNGQRIADQNGAAVTDLPASDIDSIELYAGFLGEALAVTFYFGADDSTAVDARYGQTVLDMQPWRLFDGKVVSVWSTLPDGLGERIKATDKLTKAGGLYAYAYSPAVRFDTKGGTTAAPIVADAGTSIDLPESQKPGYRFGGWETKEGSTFSSSNMPAAAVTVYAVWQRTLAFSDGDKTENAYYVPGTPVSLPSPSKSGYQFAGWYDSKSQKVASSYSMPDANVTLKAGWYEIKTETIMVESGTQSVGYATGAKRYTVALPPTTGTIEATFSMTFSSKVYLYPQVKIYGGDSTENPLLHLEEYENKATDWHQASFSFIVNGYDTLLIEMTYRYVTSMPSWSYRQASLEVSYTTDTVTFRE